MRGGLLAFIPVWVIVLAIVITIWTRAGSPIPIPAPTGPVATYEPTCGALGNPGRLTLCDTGTTIDAPLHSWVKTELFQRCMEWADARSNDWRVLLGMPARQFGIGGLTGGCSGTRGNSGSFFASRPGTAVLSAFGYELAGGKRVPYRWSVTVRVGG